MCRRLTTTAPLVVALALLATLPALAQAKVVRGHENLPSSRRVVSMRPPQVVTDVTAGRHYTLPLTITNFTDDPVDLTLGTRDLVAAEDPDALVRPRLGAPTQAGTWLHPEIARLHLESAESATFNVDVTVPTDAHPGLSAAAVTARQTIEVPTVTGSDVSRINVTASLASELLFNVRGAVRVDAHLRDSSGPRWVTHGDHPTFTTYVTDDGNSLIDGHVRLELSSRLAANPDVTIRSKDHVLVLPDGRRRIRVHWNDTPWLGWYHPTFRLDYAGTTTSASLPSVFVLPPWWVFALLVIAVALPFIARRQRRRRRARIARMLADELVAREQDVPPAP